MHFASTINRVETRYEWDERKRRSNLRKHRLDFEHAWMVLEDPNLLEFEDDSPDYGEVRFVGIGYLLGRAVVVVYTYRDANVIRVISMRKAKRYEEEAYQSRLGKA